MHMDRKEGVLVEPLPQLSSLFSLPKLTPSKPTKNGSSSRDAQDLSHKVSKIKVHGCSKKNNTAKMLLSIDVYWGRRDNQDVIPLRSYPCSSKYLYIHEYYSNEDSMDFENRKLELVRKHSSINKWRRIMGQQFPPETREYLIKDENLWIASRLIWFDQPRPPDSSQTSPVKIGPSSVVDGLLRPPAA
ncbi:hypothetical protein STEG23_032431 [Scotinomys teguina]